jgi:hypothetical protein
MSLISSAVSPYSSYTRRSISRSVASACGVALEHGLDVRRPLGREPFVQVHALGSAHDPRNHRVVPRSVSGGSEFDDAAPYARDNAPVGRSEAVMAQKVEKFRANAANWAPVFGPRLHSTNLFRGSDARHRPGLRPEDVALRGH